MGAVTKVGMIVFDAIERLDISGPLDVIGWTQRVGGGSLEIHLLSVTGDPVRDHLLDKPMAVDGSTADFGGFDLFLVPGGSQGVFLQDKPLIAETRRLSEGSRITASICTGAFLIAATGLAEGRRMTTHWYSARGFKTMFPEVLLQEDQRYVRDGDLWSSAGISAGIDMSLALVAAYWNDHVSKRCQGIMQYFPEPPWTLEEVKAIGH
jgi:transcriptional regulator GlxA family with amidase domain